MPRKADPRQAEFDDVRNGLEDVKSDELDAENADLRQENEKLRDLLGEAQEALVTESPKLFLLILAVLVAARLALYLIIEKSGNKAFIEAMIANGVFGVGWVVIFGKWAWSEWLASKWLTVAKCSLILAAMVIALDGITDGEIWAGRMVAGHNALRPLVGLIVALLICASSLFERGMSAGMRLLK